MELPVKVIPKKTALSAQGLLEQVHEVEGEDGDRAAGGVAGVGPVVHTPGSDRFSLFRRQFTDAGDCHVTFFGWDCIAGGARSERSYSNTAQGLLPDRKELDKGLSIINQLRSW